jgi:hypothetical protein
VANTLESEDMEELFRKYQIFEWDKSSL